MKDYLYRMASEYLLDADVKDSRAKLRSKVLFWFGIACLIGLLVLATRAHAEEIPVHVLERDGIVIRLMNTPCVDPVSLSMILPGKHSRFKAIQSFWPQKDGTSKAHAGCWTELTKEEAQAEESVFLLVFDDRESGAVPKSEFKRVRGQSGA